MISFVLNGRPVTADAPDDMTLLTLLRDVLGLTGTKCGCGVGECGACTVVVDKKAVCACLVLASQLEGAEVLTVEGLAAGGELSPLQRAFLQCHAVQCGFCTPGMLMSATALLLENPAPTEAEIRRAISGNLCRCTGYDSIVEAIRMAGQEMQKEIHLRYFPKTMKES